MSSNIKILDCTLRDGGYINNWNFKHDTIINVFDHVTSAGIDYMELGFLDQREKFNIDRTIMPNTESMTRIYGNLQKKKTKVVGMIDFGTCSLENIQKSEDTYLDGIRVIFKKHLRKDAMAFCSNLKALGYEVFAQAVSITSYTDEELLDLISLANEVKPYALSIVDTYGLMHKKDLFHYYQLMDKHLELNIGIGYHAHNNFQLGYANCIELMNLHGSNKRLLICDGSVFGMGKGAGNAPTELLAMYMNENFESHYDISHLLEAIDVNILDIYRTSNWGYQLKFFIAASNDCHPNYVTYLLDKKTLSVKAINEILKKITDDKKLMYDKEYIANLYLSYQHNDCDDSEYLDRLKAHVQNREILLVGPGSSVSKYRSEILDFINSHHPVIISINFIPDFNKDGIIFITNAKRYVQLNSQLTQLDGMLLTSATSNITKSSDEFDFTFDYSSLIDRDAIVPDNSFMMMLKILSQMGIKRVWCSGFDGYSKDNSENFYLSKLEYDFVLDIWTQLNEYSSAMIREFRKNMTINFITPSKYSDLQ